MQSMMHAKDYIVHNNGKPPMYKSHTHWLALPAGIYRYLASLLADSANSLEIIMVPKSQKYIITSITVVFHTFAAEEVRHAYTNHYKFSALMTLRSRDNVQANTLALVVIRARMSDLSAFAQSTATTM